MDAMHPAPADGGPKSGAPNSGDAMRRRLLLALAGGLACGDALALASGSAPDFTLQTLAGGNLRLKEQRGQVVMLNFWATWCGPCKQEMPHLNRLYEKYKGSGFLLLGVNIDDDARSAAGVASKLGLGFPVLLDTDKKVSRQYDLATMPSTVIIDRDGKIRHAHLGYKEGYEQKYEQQVRDLLKE
jgi:peroxiredoxin